MEPLDIVMLGFPDSDKVIKNHLIAKIEDCRFVNIVRYLFITTEELFQDG